MAIVTFYEKPGCRGNLRQKALLAAAGHIVEARNLQTEPWSAEGLLAFLEKLPISEWFNRSAPAIKSGELVPENLAFEHALWLLLDDPLLIRRPLLVVGDQRRVGFDAVAIDDWIGLNGVALPEGNLEACMHPEEEGSHGRCNAH